MKSTVILSLAGAALASAVTESIAPSGSYPSGCSKDYDGEFELTVETVETASSKRDLSVKIKRSSECGSDGILLVSLSGGVLTDSKNRTGYIASNYQFQFDDPPQDGAIYTAGFSVCNNDTLALGSTTTWWQCKSGDFWNLYDRNWAAQCDEIQLGTITCASDSSAAAGEASDGQVVGTSQITTTVVQTIGDGQVQAITTTVPQLLCEITDGQAQVRTTACESITTTSTVATTTPVPISQYSDGQIQVTTPASSGAATATATPATATPATATPATATPATATPATATPATATASGSAATGSVITGAASSGSVVVASSAPAETTASSVPTTVVTSASVASSGYGNSTLVTASGTASSGGSESSTAASSSSAASSSTVSTSGARLIGASSFAVVVVGLLTAYIAL